MSEHSERVRCRVEHEKRNCISTSNHVILCLYLLTKKPTLLMNENKWIDNSRTKIGQCVGAKAQDGKNALNHNNKNNNGRNFQFAKFSFIDFVLTDRRNLPGKRPNRQIFQMSIFVLSREKCHYQSHRIRNFRFFFSYIGFLHLVGKFECHCLYTN